MRPTATQLFPVQHLVTRYEPEALYLCVFECVVHVPITPPQRSKVGPQGRKEI